MLFGDHQNSEDVRRGEMGIGELQQGDVTPPAWLSESYADRTSNSMEVDITNGVIDHTDDALSRHTLQQNKRVYPDGQKYGSGFDTIPPPKQTDTLIIDLGQEDKADPGDRIRYEVTIENNGSNNGEGIQLHIVPDPLTTFVPGSFRSSPLAVNDSYTSTGNIGIYVSAANGLKANDFDDNISGATITAGTFATTMGGSIEIAADGGFMYTPLAGFTGSDSYTYTLNDGNGVGGGVPAVDMATVTITVSNLIWFIDNSSVAATEDGRLSTPFKTIANFSASALPKAGEVIFIRQTGTLYLGGFVLKNNQYLFGSGHSGGTNLADSGVLPFTVATNSFILPDIGGTRTLFRNSSGTGITLASGNTIRGVEVGRCSGVKISGTAFGTLTIGNITNPDVALSGNQQALSLTNGTFASTSKFVSISCLDSSRVFLNTVSGSLASGSTEVNALGSGGTITIDIQNSSAALDFATTTANNFNGTTVISITNSGMGSVTFSNLSMPGSANGTGLLANSGGTINIGGTSSAITARLALDITNTSFGSGATFSTITSINSGGKGVNLDNVSGPVVINGGSITNSTGIAFDVNAGSSNITYAGTISNANRAVEVTARTGGTVTFSGNIANTGTGINVASNTGGTIAFSGSSKNLNTGGNAAVTLATNGGATINFMGGGLVINTTSGTGFNATGGATAVTVQGTGNTINSTSGPALNVTSTTIGASGLIFQSISSGNNTAAADPVNGIVLNNTGSSGGLTVTGVGTTLGSGGEIQNTTGGDDGGTTPAGTGILLANTASVSISNMRIHDHPNYGIRGTSVTGFTMQRCRVDGTNGTNVASPFNDGSVRFDQLLGTCSITNSRIQGGHQRNIYVDNQSGTLNLTMTTDTIMRTGDAAGDDGIYIEAELTANVTVSISSSYFARHGGDHINFSLINSATMNATISNNAFHGNYAGTPEGNHPIGLSQSIFILGASYNGNFTYSITGNTLKGTKQAGAIHVNKGSGTATFSGSVNNNTIGDAGIAESGASESSGIIIASRGAGGNHISQVNGNVIHQTDEFGINLEIGEDTDASPTLPANPAGLQVTVSNNTVDTPGPNALHGIHLNSGLLPVDNNTSCVHIFSNNISNGGNEGGGGFDIRIRQRQATRVNLPGYAGSAFDNTAVQTYLQTNNPTATSISVSSNDNISVITDGYFNGGAGCQLP